MDIGHGYGRRGESQGRLVAAGRWRLSSTCPALFLKSEDHLEVAAGESIQVLVESDAEVLGRVSDHVPLARAGRTVAQTLRASPIVEVGLRSLRASVNGGLDRSLGLGDTGCIQHWLIGNALRQGKEGVQRNCL